MAKIGKSRHVPYRVIDSWVYKVKDVEVERLDYVEEGERDGTETQFTESESNRYKERKERIVNKTVTVEVRLCKRTVQSEEPPHPLESARLEVYCKELDIKLEGTDVEALREAMWSKLDKKFEITWETYYLVTLRHQRPYTGRGTGLELCYEHISKGTTWDGNCLLRKWCGSEEQIKPWPGSFKDRDGNVIACIKETDANEDAMKEFCRRIDLMREKLQEFLMPENIQATLNNMAGLTLLPPAGPKEEEEDTNA